MMYEYSDKSLLPQRKKSLHSKVILALKVPEHLRRRRYEPLIAHHTNNSYVKNRLVQSTVKIK